MTSKLARPCREWHGTRRDPNGYGQLRVGGHMQYVHRFVWVTIHGQIPGPSAGKKKLFVLHHCDNPPCFEPEHLWLGTQADNMRDMAEKRRNWQQRKTHCSVGHPLDEANTYFDPDGRRECRICRHEADLRRRLKWQLRTGVRR